MNKEYVAFPYPKNILSVICDGEVDSDSISLDAFSELSSALASLKPKETESLVLYFRLRFTIFEIAKKFGIPTEYLVEMMDNSIERLREIKDFTSMVTVLMNTTNENTISEQPQSDGQFFNLKDASIFDLDPLNYRSFNLLWRHDICTVEQLVNSTKQDLLSIHGLGKASIRNIEEALAKHNLSLRNESPQKSDVSSNDNNTSESKAYIFIPDKLDPLKFMSLEEAKEQDVGLLDLSVRAFNCLKRAGINTIGELLDMTETDLLRVHNLGRYSVKNIKERLLYFGLSIQKKSGHTSCETSAETLGSGIKLFLDTPEAISALLFEFTEQYGDISISCTDSHFSVSVPFPKGDSKIQNFLISAVQNRQSLTVDEFKLWLLSNAKKP